MPVFHASLLDAVKTIVRVRKLVFFEARLFMTRTVFDVSNAPRHLYIPAASPSGTEEAPGSRPLTIA